MARKENSIKNLVTSVIPFFLIAMLGFIKVNAYITGLGEEIYALNQVFFQIFSYISIAEAGAGALVTQLYYKALADKDENRINIIFTSCKYLFKRISVIIFLLGVGVSFFLEILTNNSLSFLYMQTAFVLFLIRSVIEYLMLSPRFVIQADQKLYKINLQIQGYRLIEMICEIVLLYLGINYILLLVVTILIRIIAYMATNKRIYREYPWLKCKDKSEVIPIKGISNVFYHKIVGAIYYNTDILLLSAFLTSAVVTIYSSYNYIVKTITDIIEMCAAAATPSFGNVMVSENYEKRVEIYEEINSIFILAASIVSVGLYKVITPFVYLWIGDNMIMNQGTLIIMLLVMYFTIVLKPFHMVKEVKNLYKETQLAVIGEAVINLALSIILVRKIGMVGVLLATLIARLITTMAYFPIYMYKNVFNKSFIGYYIKLFINILISCAVAYIGDKLFVVPHENYVLWFMYSILYGIIISVILFIINMLYCKDLRRVVFKSVNIFVKKI